MWLSLLGSFDENIESIIEQPLQPFGNMNYGFNLM
jgi:hypothetical protein